MNLEGRVGKINIHEAGITDFTESRVPGCTITLVKVWQHKTNLTRSRVTCEDVILDNSTHIYYIDCVYETSVHKLLYIVATIKKFEYITATQVVRITTDAPEPVGTLILIERSDREFVPPIEEPVQAPTDEPVNPPIEEPVQAPTDEPVAPPIEEPAQAPTE